VKFDGSKIQCSWKGQSVTARIGMGATGPVSSFGAKRGLNVSEFFRKQDALFRSAGKHGSD
jgi:hypothetical protein